jgi:hypothetical protein
MPPMRWMLVLVLLAAASACERSGVTIVLGDPPKDRYYDGRLWVVVNVVGTGDSANVRVLFGGTDGRGFTKCAVGTSCSYDYTRPAGAYYVEIQLIDPPGIACVALDGPGRLAHIAGLGDIHGQPQPGAENTGSMTFTVQCAARSGVP